MAVKNPLAQAALSSARFAKRRMFQPPVQIETIIVDVDRTLTREDSPKLALESLAGKEAAHKVFDRILNDVVLGRLKLGDVHSTVFRELYSRGFKTSDWVSIMEDLERSGGLKSELIGELQGLAGRGVTVVLATRASYESARWIAGRFGFHHAIGSVERVNGVFQGFDLVIGAKDEGDHSMTKLTAARKALAASSKTLDPGRTAVIANDLLDALEMLECSRGILVMPSPPNRLEKLTMALRLYDVLIREQDVVSCLKPSLGFGG
ncbi:MAG: HAD family hydrolase [Candidatus Micrarchaeia archaeon]